MRDAPRLNEYAWVLAVNETQPSEARLELARLAADRAVGLESRALPRATFRDTEATVLHRLGRHDAAIALEREILEEYPKYPEASTFATQLARFLEAAPRERPLASAARGPEGIEVRIERREQDAPSPLDGPAPKKLFAHVELAAPLAKPHVVYAPVRSGEGLAGLLRLPLPEGMTSTVSAVAIVETRTQSEADEGELVVSPRYVVEGRASAKLWLTLPKIAEYP